MFGIFRSDRGDGFTTSNIVEMSTSFAGTSSRGRSCRSRRSCCFGGAIGKSAQFPLHVVAPDAMAGPTPVSALIHAAPMGRRRRLHGRPAVRGVHPRGPLGPAVRRRDRGITASGRRCSDSVQDDIKRVLAYSTVSQLGLHDHADAAGPAGTERRVLHLLRTRSQGAPVPRLGS